jgi:nucleoside-diphosphate-sugar epimerase
MARYHNVFGPLGTWDGGREKAPAAICRKIARAAEGDEIEIWGDGCQTRSFLYIDECLEGTIRLMRSEHAGPINIGSQEMVSINHLVDMVASISGKTIQKRYIPGPLGVRGRNSDNEYIREMLGWSPSQPLRAGLVKSYEWIERMAREAEALCQ